MFDRFVLGYIRDAVRGLGCEFSCAGSSSSALRAEVRMSGAIISRGEDELLRADDVVLSGSLMPPRVSSVRVSGATVDPRPLYRTASGTTPMPRAIDLPLGTMSIVDSVVRTDACDVRILVMNVRVAAVHEASADARVELMGETIELAAELSTARGIAIKSATASWRGGRARLSGTVAPTISLSFGVDDLDLGALLSVIPLTSALGLGGRASASGELTR